MLQSESSPYISTEKYSGTLPYSHLSNMVTSLLQPLFLAQQNSHTFSYKNPRQHGQQLIPPMATF